MEALFFVCQAFDVANGVPIRPQAKLAEGARAGYSIAFLPEFSHRHFRV